MKNTGLKNRKTTKELRPAELSVRELYHRAVFVRRLFTLEEVLIDIFNRKTELENGILPAFFESQGTGAAEGQLKTAEVYFSAAEEQQKTAEVYISAAEEQLKTAEIYFSAAVAEAYFRDSSFEKDEEGRILRCDGEPVIPLKIEEVQQSIRSFRQLLRADRSVEEDPVSMREAYEAGIYRYRRFTAEQAAMDISNRLVEAYVRMDPENSGFCDRRELADLKEAKAWLDTEMVRMHLLTMDSRRDALGRYTEFEGRKVLPIDLSDLRREYEEYCRAELRQDRTAQEEKLI